MMGARPPRRAGGPGILGKPRTAVLTSRTFYDRNRASVSRQDVGPGHGFDGPHEHHCRYNEKGQRIGKEVTEFDTRGYDKPTPKD